MVSLSTPENRLAVEHEVAGDAVPADGLLTTHRGRRARMARATPPSVSNSNQNKDSRPLNPCPCPVWTEKAKVYITWAQMDDGAEVPGEVMSGDGTEDFTIDFSDPPPGSIQWGEGEDAVTVPVAFLGTFSAAEGWLSVRIIGDGIQGGAQGVRIGADAIFVLPVVDSEAPSSRDDQQAAYTGEWAPTYAEEAWLHNQHVLTVPAQTMGDPNFGAWWTIEAVPTERVNVYVTWAAMPDDGAPNAPFDVVSDSPTSERFPIDQRDAPEHDLLWGGQWWQWLPSAYSDDGSFRRRTDFGDLMVQVTADGVYGGDNNGVRIAADGLLIVPRPAPGYDAIRPGSYANREENGFGLGCVIQTELDPWHKVSVHIHDTTPSEMAGKYLQLLFDGDFIRVYQSEDLNPEGRYSSGQVWAVGQQPAELYVYGGDESGGSDLRLVCGELIEEEFVPLSGRPISDILHFTVIAPSV